LLVSQVFKKRKKEKNAGDYYIRDNPIYSSFSHARTHTPPPPPPPLARILGV
jgi:hypothetical protein